MDSKERAARMVEAAKALADEANQHELPALIDFLKASYFTFEQLRGMARILSKPTDIELLQKMHQQTVGCIGSVLASLVVLIRTPDELSYNLPPIHKLAYRNLFFAIYYMSSIIPNDSMIPEWNYQEILLLDRRRNHWTRAIEDLSECLISLSQVLQQGPCFDNRAVRGGIVMGLQRAKSNLLCAVFHGIAAVANEEKSDG